MQINCICEEDICVQTLIALILWVKKCNNAIEFKESRKVFQTEIFSL